MSYKFNPFTGKLDVVPGAPNFVDSKFTIYDDGNKTKKFQFEASAISPSTTRILDVQDVDGPIAIGYGTASQYIRGDATIANFPSNVGGGSLVNYYFNGSVSQGSIGGNAYQEISRVPAGGPQTNFSINAGSTTVYFVTDAGDPNQLSIPAGNFLFTLYCATSSGNPNLAVALYKYDGVSTFTQIGSTSPAAVISNTSPDIHILAVSIPSGTTLLATDRLAVRVIGSSLGGHTITLYTEAQTSSQFSTSFSTGLTALNGLTEQVQFFSTGTTGSDFNIASSVSTHTFNIPVASATNTGKLSSTDWSAFNGKLEYSTSSIDNSVLRADGTGTNTVQRSDINIDDATTSTQNNVAITNQHSSETNSALVLTPKGTGALIAGAKPDGTSTGGNARGADAVDLQMTRSAATQVASGTRAFIGGGQRNTASIEESVVCGGYGNTASSFWTSVVGGYSNSSAGESCAIVGGVGNSNTGFRSFIGCGISNSCSGGTGGGHTVVCGGESNTASTNYASILGGFNAIADRYGIQSHAAGAFAAQGDAQRFRAVLRCKTTTNAAVEMALNGSTTYLTIPSGKVIFMNIKVVGTKSDGSAVATYERQYAVKNVAATSSEVYAPITIGTDNAAGTSLEVATVDAGDYVRIRPTGITSETWRWVASVDAVEVAYGT